MNTEDEIDLRPFFLSLTKYWWLVLLITFAGAAIAFAFLKLRPDQYDATATILLTRTRSRLSLAEQFSTQNEPIDARSRMEAVLAIANSDAIKQRVSAGISDNWQTGDGIPNSQQPAVEITNKGDAILITASARDPVTAAETANKWAREAVSMINLAYSGEQPLEELQNLLKSALEEYNLDQANLESFIANNQIEILSNQIEVARTSLENLAGRRSADIQFYEDRLRAIDRLTVTLETLQEQVTGDQPSVAGTFGDALAVLNAHNNSLISPPSTFADDNSAPPLVTTFDLQITDLSVLVDQPSNYSDDLEYLIQLASSERVRSEQALAGIKKEIVDGVGEDEIQEIGETLRILERQLEQENSRLKDLTSRRDLSLETYQALLQREMEIRNAIRTDNYVTIVSRAVPPDTPASVNFALVLGAGTAAGLLIGLICTLLIYQRKST